MFGFNALHILIKNSQRENIDANRETRDESRAMLSEIGRFLRGLVRHGIWWITSSVGAAAFALYQGTSGKMVPTWLFWMWAALGLIIACFLAWREEHRRANEATAKKIKLLCEIGVFAPTPNKDGSIIAFISVCLRNMGPRTELDGFEFRVSVPSGQFASNVVRLQDRWDMQSDGKPWSISRGQLLYGNGRPALETGSITDGWLAFIGPEMDKLGNFDLTKIEFTISLSFRDAEGATHCFSRLSRISELRLGPPDNKLGIPLETPPERRILSADI
jgi:hypothetical protein